MKMSLSKLCLKREKSRIFGRVEFLKVFLCLLSVSCYAQISQDLQKYVNDSIHEIDEINKKGPVELNPQSLVRSQVPEWFLDAKLGCFSHWGVYVVPGYGNEWYSRNMYLPGKNEYQHHIKTYGPHDKFGYKDFIPMFKGQNFNAEEWADLYQKSGARFGGAVAEHHDGFSMWPSKVNCWNASLMGPKRDVVGELVSAFRKRDMKVVLTLHHSAHFTYYGKQNPDGKPGFFPAIPNADTSDKQFADFYGKWENPDYGLQQWLVKSKEVIDGYRPDELWFDFDLAAIDQDYQLKMGAYYYNRSAQWNTEAFITRKRGFNVFQPGTAVRDFERIGVRSLSMMPWQKEDTICPRSWCWLEKDMGIKSAKVLVHELIDTVSKNGVLLLNVCPDRDGVIPQNQQQAMLEMGQWLRVNGKAIYNTRPWLLHGEGPNVFQLPYVWIGREECANFTSQDIRYTRSKDNKVLYVIMMAWPQGPFTPQAIRAPLTKKTASVNLLGYDKPIRYEVDEQRHLTLYPPELSNQERPCDFAYVFQLSGFELTANSDVYRGTNSDEIVLFAEDAKLAGKTAKLIEPDTERSYLENWTDPKEEVRWFFQVDQPRSYLLSIDMTTEKAGNRVGYEIKTSSESIHKGECVISTGLGLDRPWRYELEQVKFEKPGQYELVLRVSPGSMWEPIRIWQCVFSYRKTG